jgi:hypothetical protein
MLALLRGRLTYANVVGTLALFVALGGVSYAAVRLPAHSVGTKQLKSGAVTSAKVRNGTLRRKDFHEGQLPSTSAGADGTDGEPGVNGTTGPKGEPGAAGPKGDPGPAASSGTPGPEGSPGPAGADGATGPAGPTGPAGSNGSQGTQGSQGPMGPMGPMGPAGGQGPSGVVTTQKISGFISAVPAAPGVWQFLGNQAAVTTTAATQRLTAAAMVPLATTSTPQTIQLDVCYQLASGGAINPFSGGAFSYVAVTETRVAQAIAGTIVPGAAAAWKVGACAQTTIPLDNNDFVNGYVQVTN